MKNGGSDDMMISFYTKRENGSIPVTEADSGLIFLEEENRSLASAGSL
jgi:hypothetical protein